MKSLKTLLSVGLAMAISSTAFAETQNPLAAIKDAAKETVTSQVNTQVNNVNSQVQNVKSAVTEVKQTAKNAKAALNSAKESSKGSSVTSDLKNAAEKKVSEVKQKATEKAKETVTNKVAAATKVNINTADAKTLQTLSGIGSAKAKAIIDYRNKVGKIKDLAELSNVSGIGSATIEKIAPLLAF